MWKEFKNFIARGNVIDLAVGVIIGAAFNKIVSSLVDDVIMPVIGAFTKGVDFSHFYITLTPGKYSSLKEAKDAGATVLQYGLFINAVIQFIIVAFVLFLIVKGVNKIKEKALESDDKTVATPPDIQLLKEIRDLLAKKN